MSLSAASPDSRTIGGGGDITAVSLYADGAAGWSTLALLAGFPDAEGFVRGDSNADGNTDIGDPIFTLNFLFGGGAGPICPEAADTNGDGSIDLADGVYGLNFQFSGGPPPPAPYPDCGGLGCPEHPCGR